MPSLDKLITEVVSKLDKLGPNLEFALEVPVLVEALTTYIASPEGGAKVVRRGRGQDLTSARDQALKLKLRDLFELRETYLSVTGLQDYHGINPVDEILEDLARAIAQPNESILKVMYPSLEVDYYCHPDATLKELTEDDRGHIQHHRFIFTEDKKAIIHLEKWVAMQGGELDLPFLSQLYGKTEGGYYTEEDYQNGQSLVYCDLSEKELDRLEYEMGEVGSNLFEEFKHRKNSIPLFFIQALDKLVQDCQDHGVGSHKSNENGRATERQAHPDLAPKIREFLDNAWWKLSEEQREEYSEFEANDVTLEDYIILLRWGIYDSLTPDEELMRVAANLHTCVELAAMNISTIIKENIRESTFDEIKKVTSSFFKQAPAHILALREGELPEISEKLIRLYLPGYAAALKDLEFTGDLALLPYASLREKIRSILNTLDLKTVFIWALDNDCETLALQSVLAGLNLNTVLDSKGNTALYLSIEKNWSSLLEETLHETLELNLTHHLGWTPLFIACNKGNIAVTETLIRHGARVDYSAPSGLTAFHLAAKQDKPGLMRVLLEAPGAMTALPLKDPYGLTVAEIFGASKRSVEKLEVLAQLITFDAPLEVFNLLRLLCERHEHYPLYSDPPHYKQAYLSLLKRCLEMGVDPDLCVDGKNTLFEHCLYKYEEGHLPSLETLKLCISKKSRFNTSELEAILENALSEELVDLCIKQGANFKQSCPKDMTWLQYAFKRLAVDSVKSLLKHGAAVSEIYNDKYFGTLCRDLARDTDSFSYFSNWSYVENRPLIDLDRLGHTWRVRRPFIDSLFKAMIVAGADPKGPLDTNKGFNLLHLSVGFGLFSTFKLCLEKNMNLELEDKKGKTALDLAYKWKSWSCVLDLIKAGAKFTRATGSSALLADAIKYSCSELAWVLVQKGARSPSLTSSWITLRGSQELKAWAQLNPGELGPGIVAAPATTRRVNHGFNQFMREAPPPADPSVPMQRPPRHDRD